MKKRILSMLLAIVMVVGLVPGFAFTASAAGLLTLPEANLPDQVSESLSTELLEQIEALCGMFPQTAEVSYDTASETVKLKDFGAANVTLALADSHTMTLSDGYWQYALPAQQWNDDWLFFTYGPYGTGETGVEWNADYLADGRFNALYLPGVIVQAANVTLTIPGQGDPDLSYDAQYARADGSLIGVRANHTNLDGEDSHFAFINYSPDGSLNNIEFYNGERSFFCDDTGVWDTTPPAPYTADYLLEKLPFPLSGGAGGGETPAAHSHDMSAACGGSSVTYTAWDGTSAFPGGNVYLSGDCAQSITVSSGTVNLCLNGHTITTASGHAVTVAEGATLNICDCSAAGSGQIKTEDTAIAAIRNDGTITIFGGTVYSSFHGMDNHGVAHVAGGSVRGDGHGIDNNSTTANSLTVSGGSVYGGGISIYNGKSGAVTVSGGSVTSDQYGILNASSGSVTVSGGSVSAGTTGGFGYYGIQSSSYGGAVTVSGGSVSGYYGIRLLNRIALDVTGGTISGTDSGIRTDDGTALISGGTIAGKKGIHMVAGAVILSGAPVINGTDADIHLFGSEYTGSRTFSISAAGLGDVTYTVSTDNAPTEEKPITISSAVDEVNKNKFESANSAYKVIHEDGVLKLVVPADPEVLYGASADASLTEGTLAEATEADAAYIQLQKDISSEGSLTFDGSVTIDLNGKTLTAAGIYHGVYIFGDLTITDSSEARSGKLSGTSAGEHSTGVYATGSVTVTGGSLSGEATGDFSAGVYTLSSITVSGNGSLSGTSTSGNGHGVYAISTITVDGGTLTGTAAGEYGVCAGSVIVTGGSLSGEGSSTGVFANGSITVTDGSLSGTGFTGVFTNGSITVGGNGSLSGTADGEYGHGVSSGASIYVADSRLSGTATGVNGTGVYTDDDIRVDDAGEITATGATAVYTGDEIGSIYSVKSEETDSVTGLTTAVLVKKAETPAPEVKYGASADASLTEGTLAEAIEANAAYIQLQKDITSDSMLKFNNSVTIDLNGRTLTAASDESDGVWVVGDLTITDSSETGSGKLCGTATGEYGYGVWASGGITVEGGSLSGTGTSIYGVYAVNDITVSGNGSLSGTATGTNGTGVFAYDNITVSGNGILSGTSANHSGVYAYGSITVTGGRLSGESTGKGSHGVEVGGSIIVTGGSLSGTATGERSSGVFAYSITVTGGSLSGTGTGLYGVWAVNAIEVSGNGSLSGEGTGEDTSGVGVNGSITVTGGSLSGTADGVDGNGVYADDSITVTGGSFSGEATDGVGAAALDSIIVTGGSFSGTATGANGYGVWADPIITVENDGKLTATGVTAVQIINETGSSYSVESENTDSATGLTTVVLVKKADAPAVTTEVLWGTSADTLTNSGTLADAIAANAAYIQLQKDISSEGTLTFNGSVTIDLNGKTLTAAANDGGHGVTVLGDLTITDTSDARNGSLSGEATGEGGYGVNVRGSITVEGGSLSGTATGTNGYGVEAGGSITVEGGSLRGTSTGELGIGVFADDSITASGGSLSGTGTIRGVLTNDSITVTGGTLSGTATGGGGYGVEARGSVTVTGGSFSGEAPGANGFGVYSTGSVTVDGGTLSGTGALRGVLAGDSITVSGGTLSGTATGGGGTGVWASGSVTVEGDGKITAKGVTAVQIVNETGSSYTVESEETDTATGLTTVVLVAPAATTYPLWVGGEQFTSAKLEISGGEGKAIYDPETNTLTLNNYTYSGAGYNNYAAMYYGGTDTLNLVLEGTSTVTQTGGRDGTSTGMDAAGSLDISGTGSLTVSGGTVPEDTLYGSSDGIYAGRGTITVRGGTVTAKGGDLSGNNYLSSSGVRAQNLTVSGGSLTGIGGNAAGGSSTGVRATTRTTVSGGSLRGIGGNAAFSYGIEHTVTISGGEIIAQGGTQAFSPYTPTVDSSFTNAAVWFGESESAATEAGAKKPSELADDDTSKYIRIAEGTTASPVASVTTAGDVTTGYTDPNEAIAAAKASEGSTLKLLEDITADRYDSINSGSFTVDLNGKTWTFAKDGLRICGTADIILTDSSSGGTGKLLGNENHSILYLYDSAKLDIQRGTLENHSPILVDMAVFGDSTAELTVSGGKLLANGSDSSAIVTRGALVKVTGGVIESGTEDISHHTGVIDLSEHSDPTGITIKNSTGADVAVSDDTILLPAGYALLDDEGNAVTTLVTGETYTVGKAPASYSVDVSAVDAADGFELRGAFVQLLGGQGNVIAQWESGVAAHTIEGLKAGVTYTLRAIAAPNGYILPADTTFSIHTDGTLDSSSVTTIDENGILLVEFARAAVKVNAVNAEGRALRGAILNICDPEGIIVTEWTSTDMPNEITGLHTGVVYIVCVATAPNGYAIPGDVTFSIDEMGNVSTSCDTDEDGALLIEFAQTVVRVKAVDAEGAAIEGATLQILNAQGSVVKEWNLDSTDTSVWEVLGLRAGEEYTLRVAVTPNGYLTPGDIFFILEKNGKVVYDGEDVTDNVLLLTFAEAVPAITSIEFNRDSEAYDAQTNTFYMDEEHPLIITVRGEHLAGEMVWFAAANAEKGEIGYKNVLFEEDAAGSSTMDLDTYRLILRSMENYGWEKNIAYIGASLDFFTLNADDFIPLNVVEKTYEADITQPEGGEVSTDNESPVKGDQVTITVTPEPGKEVVDVVVTDENGDPVPVTDNGDGTYTYEQPAGDVEITVELKDSEYEVDITQPEGGEVSTDNESPVKGDQVTVTVTPEPGKEVVDVVVTDENGDPVTVTDNGDGTYTYEQPAGDVEITVELKTKSYTVTFVDWDNKELKSETVEHGKSASAPADPTREGWKFTGWDTDFSQVTGDLTVGAKYEEKQTIVIDLTEQLYTYDGTPKPFVIKGNVTDGFTVIYAGGSVPVTGGFSYQVVITRSEDDTYKSFSESSYLTVYRKLLTDSDITFTITERSYVYDGEVKTPTVTVKHGDTVLTKGTDGDTLGDFYITGVTDAAKAGVNRTIVNGRNNYDDSVMLVWEILPTFAASAPAKPGEDGKIVLTAPLDSIASLEYAASEDFTDAEDFDASGTQAVAPGTYYVRIKALPDEALPDGSITLGYPASSAVQITVPETYSITFDTDGGSAAAPIYGTAGSAVTAPAAPAKTGYDFGGWYADAALTTAYVFGTMPAANITVYAKWNPADGTAYTVRHYHQNTSGAGYTLYESETLRGVTDSATDAEAKNYPGFTPLAFAQSTIQPDGGAVVEIFYDRNTYAVTLISNGGTVHAGDVSAYVYGVGAALPTDVTKLGYHFAGWYENGDCTGTAVWEITRSDMGDRVFYAKWSPIFVLPILPTMPSYPPVVDSGEGGSTAVTPPNPKKGDTVTVITDPGDGREVDTVTVTDESGNAVTVTDGGDGTYLFRQPVGKVTIRVTFREAVRVCPGDESCPMSAFNDLDTGAWYHDGVHFCLEKGLMNGTGKDTFAPDATLSRAMLLTVLWRAAGEPVVNYAMNFEDVESDAWYTEAIRWAASEKIAEGYGNGIFGTNDPITREQLATILYRYEQKTGGGFRGLWMFRMDFVDLEEVSDWSYEAACWMTMNGVLGGKPGKVLDPKGYASRAEAAVILQRYCELEREE